MPRQVLIALRRDTAADWTSADPVLAEGEPGFETDTGLFKIGDGTTAWTSLPYAGGGATPTLAAVVAAGNDPAGNIISSTGVDFYVADASAGNPGQAIYIAGGGGDAGAQPAAAIQFQGGLAGAPGKLEITTDGTTGSPGDVLTSASSRAVWRTNLSPHEVVLDGGGSTIATGVKLDLRLLYDAEIRGVSLLADQSGDLELDLWKCSYADFDDSTHPVIGDSIVASAPPTITAGVKSEDTTLTGWDTTIDAGDVLRVVVASATSITRATLVLHLARV